MCSYVKLAIKPEIVEVLEKQRDEELSERREKRKKTAEEEATKKAAQDGKKNAEQKMEVTILLHLCLSNLPNKKL